MADICLDFKWLGFPISDPIQNLDHLKTNLVSTIQNPDRCGLQIPTEDPFCGVKICLKFSAKCRWRGRWASDQTFSNQKQKETAR